MGFRNNEDESASPLPTLDDIAKMAPSYLKVERIRLKNEISFRRGGYGGPDHKDQIENIKALVKAIEARIQAEGPEPT